MPECLLAYAQPWNTEMPTLGVARHFARVLGDGTDNRGAAEQEGATLEWARKLGAQQTDTDYTSVPRPLPPCTLTIHWRLNGSKELVF